VWVVHVGMCVGEHSKRRGCSQQCGIMRVPREACAKHAEPNTEHAEQSSAAGTKVHCRGRAEVTEAGSRWGGGDMESTGCLHKAGTRRAFHVK
jgi:hypothetical protein